MQVCSLFQNALRGARPFVLCAVLAAAASAHAEVVTQNTVGTLGSAGSNFTLGQSVTTSAGTSWNNLTFNLVDTTGAAYANGTLFLLSQAYNGTPSALSNATAGFLASTSTISSGVWAFASSVSINANTQYFLYMDTVFDGSKQVLAGRNAYAGGNAYQSSSGGAYVSIPVLDMVFSLNGTAITPSVPEPGSLALAALALLGLGAARRRQPAA